MPGRRDWTGGLRFRGVSGTEGLGGGASDGLSEVPNCEGTGASGLISAPLSEERGGEKNTRPRRVAFRWSFLIGSHFGEITRVASQKVD